MKRYNNGLWNDLVIDPTAEYIRYTRKDTFGTSYPAFHRIGEPAVIRPDHMVTSSGKYGWYFEGSLHTFNNYCEKVRPYMNDEDYFTMILTYS